MHRRTRFSEADRRTTVRPGSVRDVDRWETDGGALLARGALRRPIVELSLAEATDLRQDAIMTASSVDGRPPNHSHRRIEWRLIAAACVLVAGGVGVTLALGGVTPGVAGFGVVYAVLLLLVGAGPVLAAGLLRGREQRAAHRGAEIVPPPS
jgi:hypothetical protein